MKRVIGTLLLTLSPTLLLLSGEASAHCQVPCGIYGDHARVERMYEHLKTVRKAVHRIEMIVATKKDAGSRAMLVRWVMTKEAHAEKIMRTIADYFMAQRIKPTRNRGGKYDTRYIIKLMKHHAVMLAAMKVKQTVSSGALVDLQRALDGIKGYWVKRKAKGGKKRGR